MDHDDIEEIHVIIGCIQGKSEKEKQQRYRPEKNHSALKEPDILIIVALHVHRITYRQKVESGQNAGIPNKLSYACQEIIPAGFFVLTWRALITIF
jgi:hypothetical protein